jgi:hypothetical protein
MPPGRVTPAPRPIHRHLDYDQDNIPFYPSDPYDPVDQLTPDVEAAGDQHGSNNHLLGVEGLDDNVLFIGDNRTAFPWSHRDKTEVENAVDATAAVEAAADAYYYDDDIIGEEVSHSTDKEAVESGVAGEEAGTEEVERSDNSLIERGDGNGDHHNVGLGELVRKHVHEDVGDKAEEHVQKNVGDKVHENVHGDVGDEVRENVHGDKEHSHEHVHGDAEDKTHEHVHGEKAHEHVHGDAEDKTHEDVHGEHVHGEKVHEHVHGEKAHEHVHGEKAHEHVHGEKAHEHVHGEKAHEHVHGEKAHEHVHGEKAHEHVHGEEHSLHTEVGII